MTTGIGVVGCGMVSHAYLGSIARASELELRALSSQGMITAQAQAERYGGAAVSLDAMLADPAIAIVVNLAPPATRHAIGRRVLEAGKSLYCEKPLATTLADARDLLGLAAARGLHIGCAPDTFLGEGGQATRAMVDNGAIGPVVGGAVAFGTRGMESWHPRPAAFFAEGGGPLLDVGPYYVTQLVNLLGPIAEVAAIGVRPRDVRRFGGGDIPVAVFTTIQGALLLAGGATVSLSMSWDIGRSRRPPIELHGETGSLLVPDPNQFGGVPRLARDGEAWSPEPAPPRPYDPARLRQAIAALEAGIDPMTGGPVGPQTTGRFGDLRGLGLVDMARRLKVGQPPRAGGALAFHVLEALLGLQQSAETGQRVTITSRVERPDPMGDH
jgi:predicted dehydrogenase